MTEQRKHEIIKELQGIVADFTATEDEPELTLFGLISRYNRAGHNAELIGGDWAKENGFDLPS